MPHTKSIIFASATIFSILIGLSSLLPAEVYSSAGWHLLWCAMGAGVIGGMVKGRLWHDIPLCVMHLSLVCMIAGGFLTSFMSERGEITLRPMQTADYFTTATGRKQRLPEAITLLSFTLEHYPGMTFPKDFRSEIVTASGDTMRISMNHIGHLDGYRLYQTSYDSDGGTTLTVSHDPAGIAAVYVGFLLFAVGGLLHLARKGTNRWGFRLAALLLLTAPAADMAAVPAVSSVTADSLASGQVLFNGETVAFSTVATRLTYKLTGRGDVADMSPEAFVASLLKYPEEWSRVPFLKIKDKRLREILGADGGYASVAGLYDEAGRYIPSALYEGGKGPLDKEIIRLDEKVALLIDLWKGELFTPLREDSSMRRTDFSIRMEIAYGRLCPLRLLFFLTITAAAVTLLLHLLRRRAPIWPWLLALGLAGAACYVWLWSLSSGIPLTDTSGMMQFLGVCVILLSACICRRYGAGPLVALSLLCAAFLLLVAWLGMKDPVMSPVMPVLASPWLSVHVSLVMLAYATLGFTLPTAACALLMPAQRERLTALSLSILPVGVYLLGLGIITGSMWANVSWGRYWAWDPKETWSLVTLMLYSIPIHRYFGIRRHPVGCNIYLILVFSSILMTYFGVNYLPSLHAYK